MAKIIADCTRDLPPARVGDDRAAFFLMPLAIGYYAFLLTAAGSHGLFAPLDHGLTFNSMLLHLLGGRFDVDPAVIGHEGYLRDGAVYSYFGIFPALLRAPLLGLRDFATTDFTRLSCLIAVSMMALFKLSCALVVWRSAAAPGRSLLLPLFAAAILMSGAQIQFLRPSIFVESMLWAGAFAAAFLFLTLRGWAREQGFTPGLMSAMAFVAGLCLLTRVSTALGLYIALGLIWLWRGWGELRHPGDRPWPIRLLALSPPLLAMLAFAAGTAGINQQRWGDPLVFVDMSRALIAIEFPDRLQRLRAYGEFNVARLGFGLIYYFMPVWVLRNGAGQLLWSGFVERTIDAAELPPGSFVLSDPLLLGLAVYGAVGLARLTGLPRRLPLSLAATGFLVPIVLMLIAISMAFRYRMEFYPLVELLALVGFWRLAASPLRRIEVMFGGAAAASIVAAHLFWLLNALSPFGPGSKFLGEVSIIDFYGSLLH